VPGIVVGHQSLPVFRVKIAEQTLRRNTIHISTGALEIRTKHNETDLRPYKAVFPQISDTYTLLCTPSSRSHRGPCVFNNHLRFPASKRHSQLVTREGYIWSLASQWLE
jgi:hypothetical protein